MNATANTSKKRTRKPASKKSTANSGSKLTLKDLERKQKVNRWIAIGAACVAVGAAGVAGYSAIKGDDEGAEG